MLLQMNVYVNAYSAIGRDDIYQQPVQNDSQNKWQTDWVLHSIAVMLALLKEVYFVRLTHPYDNAHIHTHTFHKFLLQKL